MMQVFPLPQVRRVRSGLRPDDHAGLSQLPAETAASLTADGFFKTGDLGTIDSDGFLRISGRKKDLMIVSGERLSCEIEEVLSPATLGLARWPCLVKRMLAAGKL